MTTVLIVLYGLVVVLAIILGLMIKTGWWKGRYRNGYPIQRDQALVRQRGQEAAEEAEEAQEVV